MILTRIRPFSFRGVRKCSTWCSLARWAVSVIILGSLKKDRTASLQTIFVHFGQPCLVICTPRLNHMLLINVWLVRYLFSFTFDFSHFNSRSAKCWAWRASCTLSFKSTISFRSSVVSSSVPVAVARIKEALLEVMVSFRWFISSWKQFFSFSWLS